MKTTLLSLAVLLFVVQPSPAVVISDTNIVLLNPTEDLVADYQFTVYQNVEATDPTSIWLNSTPSSLSIVSKNLDEGSLWYLASFGDEFKQSSILSGEFELIFEEEHDAISIDSEDFYLGLVTGVDENPNSIHGWVHLESNEGVLTMLGNAISYEGVGIVIGTTTPIVPEPSTGSLLLVVGTLIMCRRKRHVENPLFVNHKE